MVVPHTPLLWFESLVCSIDTIDIMKVLTLMLGVCHQFTNHCLDHANITIKQAAEDTAPEGHPEVLGEADDEQ
jgi:hypothetical protein